MNMHVANRNLGSFPHISFRKKRLTVAIHTQFDLECAEDVETIRNKIEDAISRLAEEGDAKVAYSISDV